MKKVDKIVKAVQDSSNDFSILQNVYFGEMEGSGEELLTKSEVEQQLRFVLLAERARLTEQRDLKEEIMMLATENAKLLCSLSKYLVEVPELPKTQLVKYNNSFSRLEKSVLDFFTEANETARQDIISRFGKQEVHERKAVLWDNRDPLVWNTHMVEPLLAEALKRNKFSDDVFVLFYRLLRNHAKTVATIIENVFGENAELLSIEPSFDTDYEQFLNFIENVNKWREIQGFKFEELYTNDQLEDVLNLTAIPLPAHQNLFSFDPKTEEFVNKRHLETAFEPVDYGTFPAAKRFAVFGRLPEKLDLIAVAIYRDDGRHVVYDNMYEIEGGFKTSVDVFVMSGKKTKTCTGTFIKDCEDEVVNTKVALKVVGYFLASCQHVL